MKKGRRLQKFVSLLIVLALIMSNIPMNVMAQTEVNSEFAGGSGTETDPYLIATKEQLNNIRNDLNAHYEMIADIVFTEEDFSNGGDFYNNGQGWISIGTNNGNAFTGTFNGNNHSIRGLYINISASEDVYAGLFGYIHQTGRIL